MKDLTILCRHCQFDGFVVVVAVVVVVVVGIPTRTLLTLYNVTKSALQH